MSPPEISTPESSPGSKFKSLSELTGMPAPTHDTQPDSLPQITSSSDKSYSYSSESWTPTNDQSGSTNSWSPQHDVSSPESSPESSPSPKFKHLLDLTSAPTDDTPHPDGSPQISSSSDKSYSSDSWAPTDESRPPNPGPTNNHLPSTEPNPPPTQNAKRPRPEGSMNEFESSLTKIFKDRL